MPNHYGCTGQHAEFTCLSAYYVGPKRYRKYAAWCEPCRNRFNDPEGERNEHHD